MILGFILGLPIGALLMYRAVEEERNNNIVLNEKNDNLNEDIDRLSFKNELKDDKINDLQEEHKILLENASEARVKILDLENNLELVTNSLSKENKELIPDFDSQN